jgi:hypothetical protein
MVSLRPGIAALCLAITVAGPAHAAVFNVRDHGATGRKDDDARPAIQKAIDACAAQGGGTVLLPRGEYTSGSLWLRSHVRLELAAGATLFASTNEAAYEFGGIPSKAALLNGENIEHVTITGQGTLDGQAAYEWRDDDVEHSFDHKDRMLAAGKSIRRSFPAGFPQRKVFPHLLFLSNCRDVRLSGLKWLRSPSWSITLYACERARLENLYVYTSLEEAVWADGIDMDGCRDIRIERCTVETGDDCIIFISTDVWGPARPCENITVADCRLSSASAGVKFSEGNRAGIRDIVVRDCVLTNVNRGLVFYTVLGGGISGVTISNLTIHCNRFDWFWAGDGQPFHFRIMRHSEWNRLPPQPGEPPLGFIRDIAIRNVTAHGKGSSPIRGHPESWMERITFDNVRLTLATDPNAPFDAATNALNFQHVRDLKLRDLTVRWEKPLLKNWRSALALDDIAGLELDAFQGRQAQAGGEFPAVQFQNITNARVTRAIAPAETGTFLAVNPASRGIHLENNDLRQAAIPVRIPPGLPAEAVTLTRNLMTNPPVGAAAPPRSSAR